MPSEHLPVNDRVSVRILLTLLFVTALLSLAGRLILHNVDYLRGSIESELEEYGISGVRFESIKGGWQGFHPVFHVEQASLSLPGRSDSLSMSELVLSIDLIATLVQGDLQLGSLQSHIEKMVLVRDAEDVWWLNDIALNASDGGSSTLHSMHELFHRLPQFININVRLLQIRDQVQGQDYLVQHISLLSERGQKKSELELTANLPHSLGGDLRLMLQGSSKTLQAYLEVDDFNLVSASLLAGLDSAPIEQARVDLKTWSDLVEFQPQSLELDARVKALRSNKEAAQSFSFNVKQRAALNNDAWTVDTELSEINLAGNRYDDLSAAAHWAQDSRMFALWVNELDLKGTRSWLEQFELPAEWTSRLERLTPSGRIQDLRVGLDLDQPQQPTLGLEFKHYNNARSDEIPGVIGLDGRLALNASRGRLDINSDRLTLDLGDLFRLPLKFNHVRAESRFDFSNPDRLLELDRLELANADLDVDGRGWIEIPASGAPFMSLRASYREGNAAATSKYLPVAIMPASTVVWLDSAIKQGRIPQGEFLYHSRLQLISAMTRDQSGTLHALFDAEKPVVEIGQGWPQVSSGQGSVSFYNSAMDIRFSQPRLGELEVSEVKVAIPDLMNSELTVQTKTRSNARQLLTTLVQLPGLGPLQLLRENTTRLEGNIDSEVDLLIPLHGGPGATQQVRAIAGMDHVSWHFGQWGIELEDINGPIEVEDNLINGEELEALYFGDPVDLSISNRDARGQELKVKMEGRVQSRQLATLLSAGLSQRISGKSLWRVNINLPQSLQAVGEALKITAASDLKGSSLDYPAPLAINAEQEQQLRLELSFNKQNTAFDLDMSPLLDATGEFRGSTNGQSELYAAWLHFGDRPKFQPFASGISLSGEIDYLDADGWSGLLDELLDNNSQKVSSGKMSRIDLHIGQLQLAARKIRDIDLQLVDSEGMLVGSIVSPLANGRVKIPTRRGSEAPIEARLDYLRLDELEKVKGVEKVDPRIADMLSLDIGSKALEVKQMKFDGFEFRTRKTDDRFIIDALNLERDQLRLRSSGHWQHSALSDDHVTVFNIDVQGKNLGQAISSLGLGETISDGEVKFNGQLGWSGSLFDVNWPSLIGEVDLRVDDGLLRNVEPGAGRFVGLLSFNALPRRLFLDFGDVLKQGMQFKKIEGRFTIEGETMTTENASLDSESARIRITGQTNLNQQTYDQKMIIIPKVGETLPVLGSLAAGSSVGWGLLLLQKLFQKPIEKSVEIEYKVTGSWEEPKIVLVKKPRIDTQSEQEFTSQK